MFVHLAASVDGRYGEYPRVAVNREQDAPDAGAWLRRARASGQCRNRARIPPSAGRSSAGLAPSRLSCAATTRSSQTAFALVLIKGFHTAGGDTETAIEPPGFPRRVRTIAVGRRSSSSQRRAVPLDPPVVRRRVGEERPSWSTTRSLPPPGCSRSHTTSSPSAQTQMPTAPLEQPASSPRPSSPHPWLPLWLCSSESRHIRPPSR